MNHQMLDFLAMGSILTVSCLRALSRISHVVTTECNLEISSLPMCETRGEEVMILFIFALEEARKNMIKITLMQAETSTAGNIDR